VGVRLEGGGECRFISKGNQFSEPENRSSVEGQGVFQGRRGGVSRGEDKKDLQVRIFEEETQKRNRLGKSRTFQKNISG